jgi:hypothetical protein
MTILNTEGRQAVDYFTGIEVENTAMKGKKTLFVVGIKPASDIFGVAREQKLSHIYLGTSQSFHPKTAEDWAAWDAMIGPLLKIGMWVTLDFGVEYAPGMHEMSWNESNTFIPMISVKIPNIKLYNYNTTVKLDDNTWGDTNPGVWCHPLQELMGRSVYTDWSEYVGDTPVTPGGLG